VDSWGRSALASKKRNIIYIQQNEIESANEADSIYKSDHLIARQEILNATIMSDQME
jgi:hypothetical protein